MEEVQLFDLYYGYGAVVRIIRDNIEDKHKDPAVVVVDEMGRYAVSVLSGHEEAQTGLLKRLH